MLLKYILKRLGLMIFTFVIIFLMVFVLIKLLPPPPLVGTPAQILIIQARREAFGWDKPIMVQLGMYLRQVFANGDFGVGETMYLARPVVDVFLEKLPFSMYINFFSFLIGTPIGLGLGIWAALRKNKGADHAISTLVMVGVSVPVFVFAFLIQYFLCVKLQIFPITLSPGTGWKMFSASYFRSAMPAILSLTIGLIAGLTRYSRAELSEVLTSEFMLLARTKGLTKAQATVRHALKNAMVVIFPMLIMDLIYIISGDMIIEQIFSVPGVGGLYLGSIQLLDYNFFLMLSAFYTLIGLLAGIIGDLSYQFIDPRIRMGAKS
jgi:oligopeptide transport system permease protein